jgi:hypothetical protein
MAQYGNGTIATEAGSGLTGLGSFAQGVGAYNYYTAGAMNEYEKARALAIDNHRRAVENWYDLKLQNKIFRADELAPLNEQQLAYVIEAKRPKRLTTSQYNPITGKLAWPGPLMSSAFETEREALDYAFGTRTSRDGGPDSLFSTQVRRTTESMLAKLKDRIDLFSPNEYMSAKKFLVGLKYEAHSPADAASLAMND